MSFLGRRQTASSSSSASATGTGKVGSRAPSISSSSTHTHSNAGYSYSVASSLKEHGHSVGHGGTGIARISSGTNGGSKKLMNRVSTIFSPRKRPSTSSTSSIHSKGLSPVENLRKANSKSKSHAHASPVSSLSEEDEEEDDIRRPSDLGPAAPSIYSLEPSLLEEAEELGVEGGGAYIFHATKATKVTAVMEESYEKASRWAASQPNLVVVTSVKSSGSVPPTPSLPTPTPTTTMVQAQSVWSTPSLPLFQSPSQSQGCRRQSQSQSLGRGKKRKAPPRLTLPDMPPPILTQILSFLPRHTQANLSTTSKQFLIAAQAVLYTHLDLRRVDPKKYDALSRFLVRRRNLTDLTRSFVCERWPAEFVLEYEGRRGYGRGSRRSSGSQSQIQSRRGSRRGSFVGVGTYPHADVHADDPDADPRIAILNASTATFTLLLQNMHHLTHLALPSFDIALLRHHTAFGLRSVTFLNRRLREGEREEIVNWLDGQVNVREMRFPRLGDFDEEVEDEDDDDDEGMSKEEEKKGEEERKDEEESSLGEGEDEEDNEKAMIMLTPTPTKMNFLSPHSHPYPSPTYLSTHFPLPPSPTSPSRSRVSLSPTNIPLPPSPLPPPSPLTSSHSLHQHKNTKTKKSHPYKDTAVDLSLYTSTTLLPSLTTLQAPPSLVSLLAPSRLRTLKDVTVNIDKTLYGGLRPGEIVSALVPPPLGRATRSKKGISSSSSPQPKLNPDSLPNSNSNSNSASTTPTSLRTLRFNFGKAVDKRTVEKVLGAAGAVLGGFFSPGESPEDERGREMGRETRERGRVDGEAGEKVNGDGKDGDGDGDGDGEEEEGLEILEVAVPWNGERTDEILYKTIHAILPRYRTLSTLVMRLSTSPPSPAPPSPSVCASPPPPPPKPIRSPPSAPAVTVTTTEFDNDRTNQSESSCVSVDEVEVESTSTHATRTHMHTRSKDSLSTQSVIINTPTASTVSLSLDMFPQPPASPLATPTPTSGSGASPVSSTSNTLVSPSPSSSSPAPKSPKGISAKLGRLPSLKKRQPKRAWSDPQPPALPSPVPSTVAVPTSPRTPRTPRTPSTPRTPGTPSTVQERSYTYPQARYEVPTHAYALQGQDLEKSRLDFSPGEHDAHLEREKRASQMTSVSASGSGVSVSSSMAVVDWNHVSDEGESEGEGEQGEEWGGVGGFGAVTGTHEDNDGDEEEEEEEEDETPPELTENEKRHLRMWIRQCPTLRRVVFVSRAEWGVGV